VLIVALAAFSIGRFASRPRLAEEAVIARAGRTEPLTQAPPAPPVAARSRARDRFRLRRRDRETHERRPGTPVGH